MQRELTNPQNPKAQSLHQTQRFPDLLFAQPNTIQWIDITSVCVRARVRIFMCKL